MEGSESVVYSQLDTPTRLQMVRSRLRELETAHQSLKLRIDTPSPGEMIGQDDRKNLQDLANSINDLQRLAKELEVTDAAVA